MNPTIKKIIKQVSKAGSYKFNHVKKDSVSFTNSFNRVHSFQLLPGSPDGVGLFRVGYVKTEEILKPTFESGYSSLGLVEVSEFTPIYEQQTDNPDFIVRVLQALN